jgi:hypothetical protein
MRFSASGFFSKTIPPGSTDQGLKQFQIYCRFAEIFDYENCQLSILFYCHGVVKITYGCFCYAVALTGVLTLCYEEFKKIICDSAL